jgi:excisionase family DNA binding protein
MSEPCPAGLFPVAPEKITAVADEIDRHETKQGKDTRMRKRQTQTPLLAQAVMRPQLLTIPEVARILNVGRTKVYGLIKTDGLPAVKVGDVTRVLVTSLQCWIEQREHTF